MISRRDFVSTIGALAAFTTLPRARTPRVLRIETLLDAGHRAFEPGLSFGFAEASRTAMLFGWRVERVVMSPETAPDVHAIIGTAPGTGVGRLPYVSLVCRTTVPEAFVLPRCDAHANRETRVVAWHESLEKFGAAQLNDRYRSAMHAPMTGEAWLGWFAVKLLVESAMRVGADPAAITRHLLDRRTQFDGHKGEPLWFDAGRRLQQPVYELQRTSTGSWRVLEELRADTTDLRGARG